MLIFARLNDILQPILNRKDEETMKKLKFLALTLSAVLAVSAFTACKKTNNGSGSTKTAKVIDIDLDRKSVV